MPHSPPIAKPNSVRRVSSATSEGAKAEAKEKIENSVTSIIRIGRRPNLSASRPKNSAPNGRAASVRKIATDTALMSVPNSVAIAESMNTIRSEEHTSELQSLMRTSYADFCLKKKNLKQHHQKN